MERSTQAADHVPMVTRPHSRWLAHTGGRTSRRELRMLENTCNRDQLWIVYVGFCQYTFFLDSEDILLFQTGLLFSPEQWLHCRMLEVSFFVCFASFFSKNICKFSSQSQLLSSGSLTPTVPLLPQPLHPPVLSNPAALPLLCVLHLLDCSMVSKNGTSGSEHCQKCHLSCLPTFLSRNPAD